MRRQNSGRHGYCLEADLPRTRVTVEQLATAALPDSLAARGAHDEKVAHVPSIGIEAVTMRSPHAPRRARSDSPGAAPRDSRQPPGL